MPYYGQHTCPSVPPQRSTGWGTEFYNAGMILQTPDELIRVVDSTGGTMYSSILIKPEADEMRGTLFVSLDSPVIVVKKRNGDAVAIIAPGVVGMDRPQCAVKMSLNVENNKGCIVYGKHQEGRNLDYKVFYVGADTDFRFDLFEVVRKPDGGTGKVTKINRVDTLTAKGNYFDVTSYRDDSRAIVLACDQMQAPAANATKLREPLMYLRMDLSSAAVGNHGRHGDIGEQLTCAVVKSFCFHYDERRLRMKAPTYSTPRPRSPGMVVADCASAPPLVARGGGGDRVGDKGGDDYGMSPPETDNGSMTPVRGLTTGMLPAPTAERGYLARGETLERVNAKHYGGVTIEGSDCSLSFSIYIGGTTFRDQSGEGDDDQPMMM